jgi:6-phosphogluconolactonase
MSRTLMFVGCCNRALPYFATANGKGIAAFHFDEQSGEATPAGVTFGVENPTFLAVDPSEATLNATSEVLDWNEGVVTSYAIDRQSGALTYLNKQPTRGSIAAQASFDRSGRYLLAVNYGFGPTTQRPNRSLVVYPRRPDGELLAPVAEATHEGRGPDAARQDRPHAHSVRATPDNRFLVVADLGIDRLVVYRFDQDTGAIERHSETVLPPGSGPRHFDFHPTMPRAYVVNELSSTVASLAFDVAAGRLEVLDVARTLPDEARSINHCSEIRIAGDGRRLYVANRGDDSLSRFEVDAKTGVASLIDATPSGGKCPRHFAFDPSGKFLVVANQDSDCVSVFSMDRAGGALTLLPHSIPTGTPTAIAFAKIG